jgi:hypothetical protein
MVSGDVRPRGNLGIKVMRAPRAPLAWRLRNTLRLPFIVGLLGWLLGHAYMRLFGAPILLGRLDARLIRKDGSVVNFGTLGFRVVTTAFVSFVVDQLQTETSVFGDFKYHDSGVGTTAEAVGDTDMQTTDGESRVSGTQTEASATAYQSVGTISYTTTKAITEHGLFNASTSGTLMDRTVFSAINVVSGDSIQFTYTLTLSAGG